MGALDCSTASAPPYSNQPQAAASKRGLFIPTPHTQASCAEQEIPSLTSPLQNRAQFRKLFHPDHVRFDLPSCERRLTYDKELLCVGVMK